MSRGDPALRPPISGSQPRGTVCRGARTLHLCCAPLPTVARRNSHLLNTHRSG